MTERLLLGDCLVELAKLEAESVDALVTDPPYFLVNESGSGFMGKQWDSSKNPYQFHLKWAKEALRVMKPGAFAFVMTAPRQDCQLTLVSALHDAGFNINYSSMVWAFSSGFPKSMNVSKAVDRKLGLVREGEVSENSRPNSERGNGLAHGDYGKVWIEGAPIAEQAKALAGSYAGFNPKPAVEIIIVAMKPLSEKNYTDQALKNGKGITWLDSCRIPFQSEQPWETHIATGLATTKFFTEGEQKEIEKFSNDKGRFPANLLISDDVLNDGETYKSNAGQYGESKATSMFGIGEGEFNSQRVVSDGDSGSFSRYFSLDSWWTERVKELPEAVRKTFPFLIEPKASKGERNEGLNSLITVKLMLWNGDPSTRGEELASLLVDTEQSPPRATAESGTRGNAATEWSMSWFGSESMARFQEASKSIIKTKTNSITLSKISNWLTLLLTKEYTEAVSSEMVDGGSPAGSAEQSILLTTTINERTASLLGVGIVASGTRLRISVSEGRNTHNTVKPLSLMSYLVTLGSRNGDVVLDPFMGSGTTGIAAKMLGRNFIGMEIDPESFKIAEARINNQGRPMDESWFEEEKAS